MATDAKNTAEKTQPNQTQKTQESPSPRTPFLIDRYFTTPGKHPFDQIEWEIRAAVITDEKGNVVFEQRDIEMPASWSQLATNVVVSKYFHGQIGTDKREHSLKQLIHRVSNTMTEWGKQGGYFDSDEEAETFYAELTHMLLHQKLAFNSPVWFNVGIEEKPQCSACFINSVTDSMDSILRLARTEGMLFKWGSGTGSNLSPIRSSQEQLSGGGIASGPVSFMRGYDAFAGVIKSGGKTRRAAKMVILNTDHPDIREFVNCKAKEEKKAWALIDKGYDGGFNVPGGAYDSVFYQNANHSVRVTDDFMFAVDKDRDWTTHAITDGRPMDRFPARDLLKDIAESTHICGDPGMQFDTTINDWNPCSNTDRINASNPCSEYMFLDDTACNLASINLMKCTDSDGTFLVDDYKHIASTSILAQEITIDRASYPTPPIEKNSHRFRPLGLGFANLGASLMARGVPYDSDEGGAYAACLSAIMTGQAYVTSARIAARKNIGPFEAYEENRDSFLRIIRKHGDAVRHINQELVPEHLWKSARDVWQEAYDMGEKHGFRNAQATVLAPTGTIAFMMDCDTTGIEPDIALVKYKKLVGGGMLKIVNTTVPLALEHLGYDHSAVEAIVEHIDKHDTIEGAPHFKDEHLSVFDCAFKPAKGVRSIHYMGHVRMMGAVQPFISGAISKTVNMPHEATTEEIMDAYVESWKLGLKAVAIYRDGSKRTQPLNTTLEEVKQEIKAKPFRERLLEERQAITHKFSVAGHEGYVTVGLYEDGRPGELFIVMAKEGAAISGLMDTIATLTSIALQYGVPIRNLVDKFKHTRFEPSGVTSNPEIPMTSSVIDYIFKWLEIKFLKEELEAEAAKIVDHPAALQDAAESPDAPVPAERLDKYASLGFQPQLDAPPCPNCGGIMLRKGPCYFCSNCLHQTGGCS